MKLTKTANNKYKLTKKAWKEIGEKAGWIKIANKVYQDGDRTLTISGNLVLDPNLKYDATIRDKFNIIESVITNATLSEINKWAREHNFIIEDK